MGNRQERDTERDKMLIADYLLKEGDDFSFSTVELIEKYRISTARIYKILKDYGIKTRSPKRKKKLKV